MTDFEILSNVTDTEHEKPSVSNHGVRYVDDAAELDAYRKSGYTPARCADLQVAESEGRLLEAPCKFGDVVWWVDGEIIRGFKVNSMGSVGLGLFVNAECIDKSPDCKCKPGMTCELRFSKEYMADRNIYFDYSEAEDALIGSNKTVELFVK